MDKVIFENVKSQDFLLSEKAAKFYLAEDILAATKQQIDAHELDFYETLDVIYRALCSILYNFAPTSGHPGGSISSGRIIFGLLFDTMLYDISNPQREDSDILVYSAGHKAMGMYAMWALRNELLRNADPKLLPEEKFQLRLEDLLGFRKNPTNATPLFTKFKSKPLDGHPTPLTPFVKLCTGASGVGFGSSLGLAFGAMDIYPTNPPKVNILEGEGGMTPGRVAEALAAGATANLHNVILHLDWNQASIDSNSVCREKKKNGDYVQWTPAEFLHINNWNVIYVKNGLDFKHIIATQKFACRKLNNTQPTAIIYKTIKGWKYGIEGRSSHGAGHKFASEGYYATLKEFEEKFSVEIPRLAADKQTPQVIEQNFYDTLMVVRKVIENHKILSRISLEKIYDLKEKLNAAKREKRTEIPNIKKVYSYTPQNIPNQLNLEPGKVITLREVLARILSYINLESRGAIIASSADLFGSTSVKLINEGFGEGFYNATANPTSRLLPAGGICEDAMGGIMSGISSYGHHIGVTSSYAAFLSPLEHIASRLHSIGQQAKRELTGEPFNPFIMINAHAGVKTGEDGPTHADPQALQLLQENFPKGMFITLTPWSPDEIWPLLIEALNKRPAVIAPFGTRPPEKIIDRQKFSLPPATEAIKGIYALMKGDNSIKPYHGTVVLQGNGVASIFVHEVMPEIKKRGLNMNVFYVTSMELFSMLPQEEKERIFPSRFFYETMAMTDFTLPTVYYWVRSEEGLKRTLHSFKDGKYLGSGKAAEVLKEANLDGESQIKAIAEYAEYIEKSTTLKERE